EILGGDVELGPDNIPRRLSATSVTVGQDPIARSASPAPQSAPSTEPVPPPPPALPAPTPKSRAGKALALKASKPAAVAAAVAAPDEPVLPLPDLHALRARIATLAQTFGMRIPDQSKLDIGGLSVKLDLGGEAFAFGPGAFTMERHGDVVRLTFASEK